LLSKRCQPLRSSAWTLADPQVAEWDDERNEVIFEGEGENRKSRQIWHHHHYGCKAFIMKEARAMWRS
jgi:hypothetical protein